MNTKSLQSAVNDLEAAAHAIRDEIERAGCAALASIRPVDDDDDLPLPRLEMEWVESSDPDWDWEIEYRMVFAHFLGHTQCVRLGLTKSGSGNRRPDFEGLLAGRDVHVLPFRDGAHFVHDGAHLGLPTFAVTPDGTSLVGGNPDTVAKGKASRRVHG